MTVLSKIVIGWGHKIATFSQILTLFGHFCVKTPSPRDAKVIGSEVEKTPKSVILAEKWCFMGPFSDHKPVKITSDLRSHLNPPLGP